MRTFEVSTGSSWFLLGIFSVSIYSLPIPIPAGAAAQPAPNPAAQTERGKGKCCGWHVEGQVPKPQGEESLSPPMPGDAVGSPFSLHPAPLPCRNEGGTQHAVIQHPPGQDWLLSRCF